MTYSCMLSDQQWKILKKHLPEQKYRPQGGRKPQCLRRIFNSISFILWTGAPWNALPKNNEFAPRSTSHRYLQKCAHDKNFEKIYSKILQLAKNKQKINFLTSSVDGSFIRGRNCSDRAEVGYKGYGNTLHLLVDGDGKPLTFRLTSANIDEKKQVSPLVGKLQKWISRLPRKIEADRGYDAEWLRCRLAAKSFRMRVDIPYRSWDLERRGTYRREVLHEEATRWKVERTFAWIYKKYKRLANRWERKLSNFQALVFIAFIKFWLDDLVLG